MPGETTFGDAFRLTLITDDAATARDADLAGVNRIGIDLERLGKAERQAGKDSWVSHHTLEDLANIRPSVLRAQLFARVNPIHRGTQSEIESALELGAAVLMLPNFHSTSEVQNFIDAVRGRAWTIVLIESTAALTRIRDILAIPGIDEVMIGLNDLHIQLRVSNHFEVLASPLLDMVKCEVRRAGLSWSIGGVGRVGDFSLPVPADLIHATSSPAGSNGCVAFTLLYPIPELLVERYNRTYGLCEHA